MWGGLKTETGKLHEMLTSVCGGGLKLFYTSQKLLVCVGGGGLKIETGKFLLHFQNSKSSNRCQSIYGTDIMMTKFQLLMSQLLQVLL